MDVIIQQTKDGEKEYVLVRCREISPEFSDLLSQIQEHDKILSAYSGDKIYRIKPSDIYYIEAVDRRIFLYCENIVYESKQRLYEFEQMLNANAFMRISKSTVVNTNKIKSLSVALYGRIDAILLNDEKIIVSRTYAEKLKGRLSIQT